MKALILAISLSCLKLDIVLIADMSSSVYGYQHFTAEAFQAFANRFDLTPHTVRVGVVTVDYQANLISPLSCDKQDLNNRIAEIGNTAPYGLTNLTEGFLVASAMLTEDRFDAGKIIIVVSDGGANDPPSCVEAAMQAKSMGITVLPIMIRGENQDPVLMKRISSMNSFVESDYEVLIQELQKLEVCL